MPHRRGSSCPAAKSQSSSGLVGIDHSSALVERAPEETANEGLSENVEYRTGDVHDLPFSDAEFDVVTLHTLISHVKDPGRVLAEPRRVLRPGGTMAIFDGDYASVTFAHPDPMTTRLRGRGCVRRHRHRQLLGERRRGLLSLAGPLGALTGGGRGQLAR